METLSEYLSKHLSTIASTLNVDGIAVYQQDNELRLLSLVGFHGESPRETCPFGVTPLGECAVSQEGIVRRVTGTHETKYHSYLYVPIGGESEQVGVLVCASSEGEFFDQPKHILDSKAFGAHLEKRWNIAKTA